MKIKQIQNFLFGTLRGRLILSVALVHAVMMTLFIVDLTYRHRALLLDQQLDEATALTQALSTSAAGWIAANDVAGLQELVDAQIRYPEISFAIFTDRNGLILAHTDHSKSGLFLLNLPKDNHLTVINKSPGLVDVINPVILSGKHVGWARIGLGQKVSDKKLQSIVNDGILYALLAILVGALIAWFMGRRITRRLYAVQDTMNLISAGDHSARTVLSGADEPAVLATEFNAMLDALDESSTRFKKLFNAASVPLCFVNSNGVIGEYNYRFEQTFGYTHEEIPTIDEWWQLAYPDPEYRQKVITLWQFAVKRASDQSNDIEPAEHMLTCKNGEVRTMLISGSLIGDSILASFIDITERKQAEEAIRKSEEKYRSLIQNIEAAIVVHGSDTQIVMCNPQAENLLGLTEEQLLGKKAIDPDWHFLREDGTVMPVEEYPVNQVLAKNNILKNVVAGVHRSNKENDMWVLVNADPVFGDEGEIAQVIVTFIDITDRKQAAETLQKSEASLREAQRIARMGSWELDHSNNTLKWSDEIFTIIERDPATTELTYEAFLEMVHPDDREVLNKAFTESVANKTKYELIHRIILPDARIKYLHEQGETYYNEEGKPIRSVGTGQDITERKQAENALRESELKYRQLIESLNEGIWMIDEKAVTTFANPIMAEMLGYTVEEMLGRHLFSFMDEQGIQIASRNLERRQQGFRENHEFEFIRKNGVRIYTSLETGPVTDVDGNYRGAVAGVIDITRRRQAEVALRESELKYRSIIEASSDAIFCVDENGQYQFTNQLFASTFGQSPDYFIGKTFWDIYPKEHADYRFETTKRVFQTGESESIEVEVPLPDKTLFFYATANPIKDETGKVLLVLTNAINITDIKNAEVALRKSEERFKALADNSPLAIYASVGIGQKATYINPTFVKFFGYTLEEIPSVTQWWPLAYPDENYRHQVAQEWQRRVSKAIETHSEIEPMESVVHCKDGSPKNILWGYKTLGEENWAFGLDQTERKKAEVALRRSEAIKNKMVSNIGDVIVIIDQFGINQYKSRNITKLFGWQPEELVGKSTWDNVHADDLEAAKKFIGSLSAKPNAAGTTEIRYKRKDGNYVWIEITVLNLLSDPDIQGFLGNYHDISDRKQIEFELIKAKEKAEESDRLKTAFLCNMSHEIRTPMNGILGFSSLLSEPGLESEEQQEYIKLIHKCGDRMLNIISEIMDISKIESGLTEIRIKEVNITKQLESVYKLLKPDAEVKAINLFIKDSLPMDDVIIMTDGEKLFGILSNLVKNAIKYTDKGSVEFGYGSTISLTKLNEIQFYVKDTGIGIPKDRQQAIFDRFIQADIADIEARQGAGLGLSIAQAYVEMLGGKIWVESEQGKGSCFYFTIPYSVEPEEKNVAAKVVQQESFENHIYPEVLALKILIAEDDEVSKTLFYKNLKPFSKQIIVTTTGLGTIEACRNTKDIDLILMDIRMPNLNGYEATRQIRQFNKDVVIIAQTSFGLSGDREKAIEAGCNDYIAKPIDKDELLALIHKYFVR
jgi:PAS domain S-box-containing protein